MKLLNNNKMVWTLEENKSRRLKQSGIQILPCGGRMLAEGASEGAWRLNVGVLIQCHGPNMEGDEGTVVPETIGSAQESGMTAYASIM